MIRCAEHVARMGKKRYAKENDLVEDLRVDGRITLIWIIRKRMDVEWITMTQYTTKWWVINLLGS